MQRIRNLILRGLGLGLKLAGSAQGEERLKADAGDQTSRQDELQYVPGDIRGSRLGGCTGGNGRAQPARLIATIRSRGIRLIELRKLRGGAPHMIAQCRYAE